MARARIDVVQRVDVVAGSPVLMLLRYRDGARPVGRVAAGLRLLDGRHLVRNVVHWGHVATVDTPRPDDVGGLPVAVFAALWYSAGLGSVTPASGRGLPRSPWDSRSC